jgi:hypothetical protein
MIAPAENPVISLKSEHVVVDHTSPSGRVTDRPVTHIYQNFKRLGVSFLIHELEGHVDVGF